MGIVLDKNGSKKVAFFSAGFKPAKPDFIVPADDNLTGMPLRMGSTSI